MRKILAAIRAALRCLMTAFRWVLRITAAGVQKVLEAIPAFGGGGGGISEALDDEQLSAAAKADERTQQEAEAARQELGALCQALRRCAAARADGLELPPEDAAMLAPCVATWIRGLREAEAAILCAGGLDGLRQRQALVESGFQRLPEGVRSAAEVLRDAASPLRSPEHKGTEIAIRIRRRRLDLAQHPDIGAQEYACGYSEQYLATRLRRRRAAT